MYSSSRSKIFEHLTGLPISTRVLLRNHAEAFRVVTTGSNFSVARGLSEVNVRICMLCKFNGRLLGTVVVGRCFLN